MSNFWKRQVLVLTLLVAISVIAHTDSSWVRLVGFIAGSFMLNAAAMVLWPDRKKVRDA